MTDYDLEKYQGMCYFCNAFPEEGVALLKITLATDPPVSIQIKICEFCVKEAIHG